MTPNCPSDVVKVNGAADPAPQSDAFLAVVQQITQTPGVDVAIIRDLLEMRRQERRFEAEIVFNEAMKAAQDEIQPVARDAENQQQHSRYALLETIDAAIRPVYTKHGFSMSFDSGEPLEKGNVLVLCDCRHDKGHTKQYRLEGGLDMTGPKGLPNKTSIQGLGSSVSYLRRYLTCMIFNVVLKNEDNDGQKTGVYVTEKQEMEISDMLCAVGIPAQSTRYQNFLAFAGADSISHIRQSRYQEVLAHLRKLLAKAQEGIHA